MGLDRNAVKGEWTARTIHSRGPGGSPAAALGNTRRANVTGAPSTNRTGTNMFSVMCSIMCTLNIAEP